MLNRKGAILVCLFIYIKLYLLMEISVTKNLVILLRIKISL